MSTPLGMLAWTEGHSGGELVEAVQRLERLGYHEIWLPELNGREPFSSCGYLLAKTSRMRVSCGIANVYVRDADAVAQGARTLAELSGGRFSLGLGVSHPTLIEARGHTWERPVAKMRHYLNRVRTATIESPGPTDPVPVFMAAHGPGLWRVAAQDADGVLTNLLLPETIRRAREILGPGKQIHVLVRCVLHDDPERVRALVRRAIGFYMALPAYHRAWGEAGFSESDWQDGGSDRLIDALCAWGEPQQIRERLGEFERAGATHIVLVGINPDDRLSSETDLRKRWHWGLLEGLAPAATGC